ncbi:MAG: response regulator transcription factor [Candidatus Obscuribacterales bacterium]|nr:response regulator transcription factor [Cyanobacteria bacterium HKST-UBA01]MCB9471506.1 response regulator transcription factor [Candidatus Obscuribacterales bacterium]
MAKILIVEDDLTLADYVKRWLESENHVVDHLDDGQEAISHLKIYEYDVVVLDVGLPGMSGIEVIRTYRQAGGKTPVIFLTGKDSIDDKMTGLDSGGDDYLTKPFNVKELSARIRALLRRTPDVNKDSLTYHDISMDTSTRTVKRGTRDVKLSAKEFALLEFLMRHPEQVFSAQALIDRVWTSYSDVSPESVRTYVTRLRSKIDDKDKPTIIQSLYGAGYKLKWEE